MKKRWYLMLLSGLSLLLIVSIAGCSQISQEDLDATYANGYGAGTSDGLVAGQAAGYDDGLAAGQAAGYVDGLAAGQAAGYVDGMVAGRAAGYDDGFAVGNTDGNAQGYQVGYWEAYHVFLGYLAKYEYIGDTEADFSIEIMSLTSPTGSGSYATLSVTTLPYAWCDITVTYASGESAAEGLYAQRANGSGYVSWTWKIDAITTAGTWPIVVIASLGGIEVTAETYIDVTQLRTLLTVYIVLLI